MLDNPTQMDGEIYRKRRGSISANRINKPPSEMDLRMPGRRKLRELVQQTHLV